MKKGLLAFAVLAVSAIPAVLAAAYLFGCCVLPFHQVLHKLMPLCAMAVSAFTDEAPSTTPAEKDEPRTKITTDLPRAFRGAPLLSAMAPATPVVLGARSSLSPGAARCDRDVGLHLLLLATFRI